MSVIQIPNLTPAIGLTGSEQMEAVQSGSSVRVSLYQIYSYVSAQSGSPITGVTMRQMRMALSASGVLDSVNNNIPGDINSSVNIQWNSGSHVTPGDPLAVSIQTTTGYSNAQMAALFVLAEGYPP